VRTYTANTPFPSQSYVPKATEDPIETISIFFNVAKLPAYCKLIKNVLLAAGSPKVYKKDEPGNLVTYFQQLQALAVATYTLRCSKTRNIATAFDNEHSQKMFNFRTEGVAITNWAEVPRALSLKEYHNPYIVLKKFFAYQSLPEWQEDLNIILNAALVTHDLSSDGMELKILPIYLLLMKLVEAAYVIHTNHAMSRHTHST
jgi:hypothetical protein